MENKNESVGLVKNLSFLTFLMALLLLISSLGKLNSTNKEVDVSFKDFVETLNRGQIKSVTIIDDETLGATKIDPEGKESKIKTITDTDSDLYKKILLDKGIVPNYNKKEKPSLLFTIIISWLPIIIFFGVLFYFMRRNSGVGPSGKPNFLSMNLSDLKGKAKNPVMFNDVAGVDEAKQELVEVVDFLKNPKKFTELGGRLPKGVLLIGPPGTGKTMLAKATANEAGVPFYSMSGSNFVELFVGVGASRVRSLFEQARKNAPCIIFIDEIDSIGKSRGTGALAGSNDEREQTLNQLLVELDGFESTSGIILIGATNRVDTLDSALLRPGRFDRRIHVSLPDVRGRDQILKAHARKIKLVNTVDLMTIAKGTPGFSGAELENLINEAAIHAARSGKLSVTTEDLESARDKIMMGYERKSLFISDKEKRVTSYHEIGHALINKLLPGLDPLHKVSIIPRGNALGVTQTLPEDNMLNLTKQKAEAMICMLFGGRVAEELIFNQVTTGASNDLERASTIARKMVCEWGMSESLGLASFSEFSNRQFGEQLSYSPETLKKIDDEVLTILTKCYQRTKSELSLNSKKLIELSELLIEKETLSSEEFDSVFYR